MRAAILDTAFKGPLLPPVDLQCTDNPPEGRRHVSDCIHMQESIDHYDVDVSKTRVANMIQ